MDEPHNRRSTDEQYFRLFEQYKELKREVEILRRDRRGYSITFTYQILSMAHNASLGTPF